MHLQKTKERSQSPIGHVYILPFYGMPYNRLFAKAIVKIGWKVTESSWFPRRGIFFAKPLAAIHLHFLDGIFIGRNAFFTYFRMMWFRLFIAPTLRFRKIVLVWTCHELVAHENDPENITGKMAALVARSADWIVLHNQAHAENFLQNFPHAAKKIVILPPGDLSAYYAEYENHPDVLSRSTCERTLASIGSMRWNKGNDRIVRAFRRLADPGARLVMIGECRDPQYRAELQALAQADKRITLKFGPLSEVEVVAAHRSALATVFGYRECPTSGAVISAMSLAKAVIGPAVGHMSELVDGTTGWLVANEAVEDGLVEAMAQALADPEQTRKRGISAKLRISKDDWSEIAGELTKIYSGNSINAKIFVQ